MATTTTRILKEEREGQRNLAPKSQDMLPWLTRYIFVPFRDRELSSFYQSQYGITKLRQGIITPIGKFERTELDDNEINRVPTGPDGQYESTHYGVGDLRQIERAPADVVAGILRSHNPFVATNGVQDNGIIELISLRGQDDDNLIESLQSHFLPEIYPTCREQTGQLELALASAPNALFVKVGQELLRSTQTAQNWARQKHRLCQRDIEKGFNRGGKDEVSPLDQAICLWLELPEPKLQSRLQVQAQGPFQGAASPQPVTDQGQCATCGSMFNFLPNGDAPKICGVCRTPLHEEVEEAPTKKTPRKPTTEITDPIHAK